MSLVLNYVSPDMSETDEWLRYLYSKGRKENTLRTHRANVRHCLKALRDGGRSTSALNITEDDVQYLWKTIKVKEGVRHAYLRSLSGMVEYHTHVDIVKQAGILCNRESCERVFITKEQFRLAYRFANPLQRLIICLGAYMGLRRKEMSEIRDEDIKDGRMTIHGKGHGEDGLVVTVPIPEPVKKAIDGFRRSPMGSLPRLDDYLLQNRGYDGWLHRMEVNRISAQMTTLGKQLGFQITTHSLRRFYATVLYYDTESDLQTVRVMMRHADVSTTLKCYVNAYEGKRDEAREKLTDVIDCLLNES